LFEEFALEYKYLLIETVESIAWVKINRPESLNALNSDVITSLRQALQAVEQDPEVKVVVIIGAGEKAFVAGGDIKEMSAMSPMAARAFSRSGQNLIELIGKMSKPVIAAVNGYALGGGLELALACDFIYASENSRFGLPEVTLGVIPGFGGTQNLARLIGPNKARELIFSGRQLTAQQARDWGIVNQVFPVEELAAQVKEIAIAIARNGMLAVANAKDAIINGLDMPREDGLRYESALFATLFATEDQKEGMQAFVSKRKPGFNGR
jgi:enoyl-CoA hydratase